MRFLYPCLLLGTLLACKRHGAEEPPTPAPTPDTYDVLAKGVGHWQWNYTQPPFYGEVDSAQVGYGRQLSFRADSTVLLRRTSRPDTAVGYHLSAGLLTSCGNHPARLLSYSLREPWPVANTSAKYLSIGRTAQGVMQLHIIGVGACVDGGLYEYYHWVGR